MRNKIHYEHRYFVIENTTKSCKSSSKSIGKSVTDDCGSFIRVVLIQTAVSDEFAVIVSKTIVSSQAAVISSKKRSHKT